MFPFKSSFHGLDCGGIFVESGDITDRMDLALVQAVQK